MHHRLLCSLGFALSLHACLGSPRGLGGPGGAEVPASMQPAPNAPTQEQRAMAWNLHYTAPDGWRTQDLGSVTVHGSPDTSRAVFVGRAMFRTFDEALVTVAGLSRSLGLTATGVVAPPAESTVAGLRAVSAAYAGYNAAGMPAQSRLVVLFTPHGTSLTFLGLSAPDAAPEVAAVVNQMATSARAGAPAIDEGAVRALAGRWVYTDGSYRRGPTATSNRGVEATLVLDGAGGFQFTSNSWVSVDVRRVSAGETPVDLGSAESSRGLSDAGRYTVVGREVVLAGSQGQLVLPYALQGAALTLGATTYGRQ